MLGLLVLALVVGYALYDWQRTASRSRAYSDGVAAARSKDWDKAAASFGRADGLHDAAQRGEDARRKVQERDRLYGEALSAAAHSDWGVAAARLNQVQTIQPAYRDTPENGYLAADLGALVDKIGPCILLGWSTGTGNVMVAATSTPQRMNRVKGVIGLEGFPPAAGNAPDLNLLAKIPFLGLVGDNTSPTAAHAYTAQLTSLGGDATSIFLPDIGLFGNGHTMALELNNEQIADVIENWIRAHVPGAIGH